MRKWSGILLITAGAALTILALSLFLYNRHEDLRAGDAVQELMPKLRTAIAARETVSAQPPSHEAEPPPPEREPSPPPEQSAPAALPCTEPDIVEIDGYNYIGYLTLPRLELELPVMAQWDYSRLKTAPCRQFGTAQTDDLVIAGHNYDRHFGRLSDMQPGDSVLFTGVDGVVNDYVVMSVKTLAPTEVEAVQNSGCDLVLYTCTFSGKTRTGVFCNRQTTLPENRCASH